MKETLRSHVTGNLGNLELTHSQAEAVSKLGTFLAGDTPLFLLKGYAGTGKTFLIKVLASYFDHIGREFYLMAPTGRAGKVLRENTDFPAYTIHKSIYDFTNLKEYQYEEKDGDETYRFFFDLSTETHNTDTVFILDEASMISDKYNDNEFLRFGSGHLLADLLHFATPGPGLKRKIIFVGDSAQLPPVNMTTSPALNKEYLKDHYNLEAEEYLLTDVVRQKKNSGILANATRLRNSILHGTYNQFKIDTGYPDVTLLPVEDIIDTYRAKFGQKVDENSVIIAYSNSKVRHYNQMMRAFLFPDRKNIVPGDRVLVVKNNYNYPVEIFNGDFSFIKAVSDQPETHQIPLYKLKQKETIELTFRDIVIEFRSQDQKPTRFSCKMIENLLFSPSRDLSNDEKKALYIDFKIRHPKLKPGDPLFAEVLKKDPYFNCLFLKFGYAVTCHKAQGGEWENAFVDFHANTGYQTEGYYRWAYTAMTRGKKYLFAVNPPQFDMHDELTPIAVGGETMAKPLVLPPQVQNAHEHYFSPSEGDESLKKICCAVHHMLTGSPYIVERITHLQ
ncbi:MAG: AAA family ATPase, partial [Firmicutes bacterium]|nr:AAA family ATPase [Bacillota bacterium]